MCFTTHKCKTINCNNIISQEEIWCELCVEEISNMIENNHFIFSGENWNSQDRKHE